MGTPAIEGSRQRVAEATVGPDHAAAYSHGAAVNRVADAANYRALRMPRGDGPRVGPGPHGTSASHPPRPAERAGSVGSGAAFLASASKSGRLAPIQL
jgi:hypothetical protein